MAQESESTTETKSVEKSEIEKQMELFKEKIEKAAEKNAKEQFKDPQMKELMGMGKKLFKYINKQKEDPAKDLLKKKVEDLMPITREIARKEITALINNKAIKSEKAPKSFDALMAMARAYAAYLILSEKEVLTKKATTPKEKSTAPEQT